MTVDPSMEACVKMGLGVFSVRRWLGHSEAWPLTSQYGDLGISPRGNRKYRSGRGFIAIAFLCGCIFILRKRTE